MRRVLLVGYNFNIGGVQTAMINMLKEIDSTLKDFQIDVFMFAGGSLESEVPKNVRLLKGNYFLNLTATPFSEVKNSKKILDIAVRVILMVIVRIIGSERFFGLMFKMHKLDKEYDAAISYFNDIPNNKFNQGCNKFVLENAAADKKIAWIHTDPIKAKFDKEYCRKIYKNFDAIVSVSNACKNKFDIFLPEYKEKSYVVNNFFPISDIKSKSNEYIPFDKNKITAFVTVGRIENTTKRIDKVSEICRLLKEDNLDNFKWYVVGDGPDLKKNKEMALQYNLNNLIEFVGNKINPFPYIKNADFLVVTSDYEGYPMVVEEALLLKTPVIITNYSSAHEQVKDGCEGIITGMDVESLYSELKELLRNPAKVHNLKENLSKEIFTNDIAMKQLFTLISEFNHGI